MIFKNRAEHGFFILKIVNFIILSLISVTVMSPVHAWWDYGHKVISNIAERHLHDGTKTAIKSFSEGKSLEDLSIWPDKIKSNPRWSHTRPWHYINIDDKETLNTAARNQNGDVLKALVIQYMKIADTALTNRQRWQALGLFIHFTGDIHQPLHVGRKDDRGGNAIDIKWIDTSNKVNLHQVWDGLLIENDLSIHEYAKKLDVPSAEDIVNWQTATFADWARESGNLRDQVYDFGAMNILRKTPRLGEAYALKNKSVAQERILISGIRLAGALNALFSEK